MQVDNKHILFVSNFLSLMDEIESEITASLSKEYEYEILTYRKTSLANAYSYEEYLDNNYDYINQFDIKLVNQLYPNVNFYLAVVAERMISDYYGLEGVIGNKKYSGNDVEFIIKSFVLFFEPYIKKSQLIFSGYPDNLISHIVYMLSEHHKKKCLSFHPVSIVSNDMNYLSDDIYHKVYDKLIVHTEEKNIDELLEYIKTSNAKASLENAYSRVRGIDKPLLGFISPNITGIKFWKYIIFGYKVENKKIKKYLEIDRISVMSKLYAYYRKIFNIVSGKLFFKSHNVGLPNTPIIYFPLQVQPEASTSVTSPLFMNLLSTIELISKSLPLGYTLVVKEHPAVKGIRGFGFYKKLACFPNVLLVSNNINGREIIQQSELIIGFGGTTLIESIYLGKKFLLLEDSFYSDSKLIKKLKNIRKMREEILDLIKMNFSEEDKKFELKKMLNFFYQRGFPRYKNFEKNIAANLMKVYEIENGK